MPSYLLYSAEESLDEDVNAEDEVIVEEEELDSDDEDSDDDAFMIADALMKKKTKKKTVMTMHTCLHAYLPRHGYTCQRNKIKSLRA